MFKSGKSVNDIFEFIKDMKESLGLKRKFSVSDEHRGSKIDESAAGSSERPKFLGQSRAASIMSESVKIIKPANTV